MDELNSIEMIYWPARNNTGNKANYRKVGVSFELIIIEHVMVYV